MKKSTLIRSGSVLALALFSGLTMAANTTLSVEILGPGGHSNGDYGNVNAVHVAARAAMNIGKVVPDAVVTHVNGGNSVNSIAADAHFQVMLSDKNAKALKAKADKVKAAIMEGCAAENAFRGVKPGAKTSDGLAMDIRCTVK